MENMHPNKALIIEFDNFCFVMYTIIVQFFINFFSPFKAYEKLIGSPLKDP